MRSGEVARVVSLGYDVLHTDVDVVWLRNPAPYVACSAAPEAQQARSDHGSQDPQSIACETLCDADVAVSSDNMSPGRDTTGGISYAVGGTLNTGILLVRATAAGKRFAAEWHSTVLRRSCKCDAHGRAEMGDCNDGEV